MRRLSFFTLAAFALSVVACSDSSTGATSSASSGPAASTSASTSASSTSGSAGASTSGSADATSVSSASTGGEGGAAGTGAAGSAGSTGGSGGGAGTTGTGGSSDAGNPVTDAATSFDAAIYGGASKCASSHFQLCDDFESGTIDRATWTVMGGTPAIDGMHVARGTKALHINLGGNGESTQLRETKTFREPDNTYYGRVFLYFKSLPMAMGSFTYAHWTLLAATGDGPGGGAEIRFGGQLQQGTNRWGTGTDNRNAGGTGDWTNIDQDPAPDGKPAYVPTGQWMCIEWMHAGPDTNETKMWWDGIEHTSIATTKTEHGAKLSRGAPTAGNGDFILPNFTALWIGWAQYQTGGPMIEYWMDEIAIDHARIGCDN